MKYFLLENTEVEAAVVRGTRLYLELAAESRQHCPQSVKDTTVRVSWRPIKSFQRITKAMCGRVRFQARKLRGSIT